MKLAACYCVWGDDDLLRYSLRNIRPLVDLVIVVYSNTSNFGETIPGEMQQDYFFDYGDGMAPVNYKRMEPDLKKNPRDNETAKRNRGIEVARELGCTHFLTIDADEMYDPAEFKKAKQYILDLDLIGLVCPVQTFFKSPNLTIGLDVTLVPFIHVLLPKLRHEFNRNYPFAWEGKQIRIDPTRSMNINKGDKNDGILFSGNIIMRHYSWVRRDYNLKIRNSTARTNLERSTILEDLANAAPGYYCKFYQKTLTECANQFGIPTF